MTLSKSDERVFGLIFPHLGDLQAYVDENIKGSNSMTAQAVYDGFGVGTGLSANDFINAFRLAVRIGKITGIESAKRAGYKRVGSVLTTKVDGPSPLEPYLVELQKFIDSRITGEVRMTAAVIYKKFKAEKGCELSEDDFVKAFRMGIRDGKITGLESAYRFGYKEAGEAPAAPVVRDIEDDGEESLDSLPITSDSPKVGVIYIDDDHRVISLDRLNWGYQARKGSGVWVTEAYYSNAFASVRSIVRKLMDESLKETLAFDIDEFEDKLGEVETKLTNLFTGLMSK